ncbi:MAG: tellurite resistance TerB family protein, partial [Synergistaceae bacterium]|nr:tellurite resistance TerB family protein [Synergistaceae bacterium]
ALLGTLLGGSKSTTTNALGGGMMGLLGMLAYKALKNSNSSGATSTASQVSQPAAAYVQPSRQQQASDAEIILTAMIDAAKADGQVDANEINKIMSNLQSSGAGQEGVNYIISKLQGPMETAKIVAAVKNRPELAVQVYSASLMAIEVDTDAERKYLDKLAKAMGLSDSVVKNIEQLTSANSKNYVC